MSASSGILPSKDLHSAWSEAQNDTSLRCLCVSIENEQLIAGPRLAKAGSAVEDYGRLEKQAEANRPAFFLFKLDASGWLLVVYVPDVSPVRQKMLYASSRANLTRALGDAYFVDSLHAHSPSDLTSASYRAHIAHSTSSAPLTERERELADLKAAEGIEARGTAPTGSAFSTSKLAKGNLAWNEEAVQAARQLAETRTGAIHLILDVPNEAVVLASQSSDGHLSVPTASPSYNIVAHRDLFVLCYCCPASSPIKARLLSSASLQSIKTRAADYGIQVAKRVETSEPAEVTSAWLDSELGVSNAGTAPSGKPELSPVASAAFSRPKRPGGKASTGRPETSGVSLEELTPALPAATIQGEAETTLP